MKKLLFTSFFTIGLLCGCKESVSETPPPDGSVYSENFVQLYVLNNDINLSQHADRYISIQFKGELISNADPEQRYAYDELSLRYKDRSYNARLLANHNYALAEAVSGFGIICRRNFDETHQAGTPMNDIVKLCASSCRDYVGNGYKAPETGNIFPAEFKGLLLNESLGYAPIFKELNGLDSSYPMELLDKTCYLYFTKTPQPGEYIFDVSLNIGGKAVEKQVTMNFKRVVLLVAQDDVNSQFRYL